MESTKDSIKHESQPIAKQAVSRGRQSGQTHEMVLEIKKTLEEWGECGVGLMTDPTDALSRLKDLGVNARAEPIYRTMPPMVKKDEHGNPVDILLNEKVQTGCCFYLC